MAKTCKMVSYGGQKRANVNSSPKQMASHLASGQIYKTCSCCLGFLSMGRNDESTLFFDGSNLEFEDSRG